MEAAGLPVEGTADCGAGTGTAGKTPEITLKLDAALTGKPAPGETIEFTRSRAHSSRSRYADDGDGEDEDPGLKVDPCAAAAPRAGEEGGRHKKEVGFRSRHREYGVAGAWDAPSPPKRMDFAVAIPTRQYREGGTCSCLN